MVSWKENKEKNKRYKKSKYKGHKFKNIYSNNYNRHCHIKRHYKDYNNYKSSYNPQSNRNNYNNGNYKYNYIEKEIEINSKGETDGDSEFKISERGEENMPEHCKEEKKSMDFHSQDKTEEIPSSLEDFNLSLIKSQSEELSNKNMFNFHEVGIKLFPGAFHYNKKKSYEKNNESLGDNYRNQYNLECDNYLCKTNVNSNCKKEQKNGLELAFDYYSSFLEDKIIK